MQALGHDVSLIPPHYVKPFVKTNKNDACDAEAICEALPRPTTMLINALRGHCGEFGLIAMIEDPEDNRLPGLAREALDSLITQLKAVQAQITGLEKRLMAWHRASEASRRLETIPGVGAITATAFVATIGDASQFHSGRQLAAWLGLVSRQYSSGGKEQLGRISKHGDGYLRKLLVHGARSVLLWSRHRKDKRSAWLEALLVHEPIRARSSDLDLIRGSPCRPAASEMAAIQGLTEDCTQSLSHIPQKTSCIICGNHRRASGPRTVTKGRIHDRNPL